jgi:tRNA pseudouridine55 synthase
MAELDTGCWAAETAALSISPGRAHGILVVDKPEGLSSFQTVQRVAGMLSLVKAGHCGTLDPFATGVLLVAVNQGTRIVDQLTLHGKEYVCTAHFGVETDTLDRTGRVQAKFEGPAVRIETCESATRSFLGSYEQEVPRFSAVQVGGRRLYRMARKGLDVTPPRRTVTVESLTLLDYQWPRATFRVRCAKGTYIRQLIADIGRKMGCGAHVEALRRTASGPFTEDRALSFAEIERLRRDGLWTEKLVPLHEALAHLPSVHLADGDLLGRLRNGDLDRGWQMDQMASLPEGHGPVCILTPGMQLAALWWPRSAEGAGRCLRVFPF